MKLSTLSVSLTYVYFSFSDEVYNINKYVCNYSSIYEQVRLLYKREYA
jgi:hypothetical protein